MRACPSIDLKRFVRLEAQSFWFRSRNHLICWALEEYFPNARSFFELGCGTGFVISAIQGVFPQLTVSGGDLCIERLRYAEARLPLARFLQIDARRIPFKEEFDVVGAFDVLEHIEEDEIALSQMYNAVKPSGGILLTVPQHKFMWSGKDSFAGHKRRYSRKELVKKVSNAGFEVVRTTSFVSILFPLMILSRLRQRNPKADWNPMAELEINRYLDTLLEKILGLERCLIKCGVSFPVGGSLLIIGKRKEC